MDTVKKQLVLLGITGSIAAYKAAELVRLYQKADLDVKVIMTEHAQEFVGATTFRALTGHAVATEQFDDPGAPINHISLAQEADVLVIAPCSANMLNKIAHGIADDLLSTTALATTAPLVLAPAMNVAMLQNPLTQESLKVIDGIGATIVGPGTGYLACGTEDSGRMSDPAEICEATLKALARTRCLAGMRVLITTGPTREYLDPVRFISSPSSGKTGFALAKEAKARGAEVVLISGPTELLAPSEVEFVPVVTAEQMLEAASEYFDAADIAIFSAAVADYRPTEIAAQKLKKRPIEDRQSDGDRGTVLLSPSSDKRTVPLSPSDCPPSLSTIQLTENPDILATLAARRNASKAKKPFVVGFAAETENVLANAEAKLAQKGADLIIANDVSDPKVGFASEHNKIYFVDGNTSMETQLMSKEQLAGVILGVILDHILENIG